MSTDTADHKAGREEALPVFSRKSTGLVRQVSMVQMIAFTAASTNPLGLGLVFFTFALVAFPRANPYIAIGASGAICIAVWVALLLTSAIPRVGGDYTINTRIIPAWLALGGNIAVFHQWDRRGGAVWHPDRRIGVLTDFDGDRLRDAHALGLQPGPGLRHQTSHGALPDRVGRIGADHPDRISVGTRTTTLRVMTWLIGIATVGLLADVVIMLFTSHSTFVSTVNNFSGHGAYASAVAAGAKQNLYPGGHGYSTSSTIGAIYLAAGVTIWTFWGTYLSSEFKGAGVRRRQMTTMVGTGVANTIGLILLLVVFTHTIGYNFFASSVAGNFHGVGNGAIGTAGYVYFGALVANNSIVVTLVALAFLGWWVPAIYINIAVPHRALLTWSLDGLFRDG